LQFVNIIFISSVYMRGGVSPFINSFLLHTLYEFCFNITAPTKYEPSNCAVHINTQPEICYSGKLCVTQVHDIMMITWHCYDTINPITIGSMTTWSPQNTVNLHAPYTTVHYRTCGCMILRCLEQQVITISY